MLETVFSMLLQAFLAAIVVFYLDFSFANDQAHQQLLSSGHGVFNAEEYHGSRQPNIIFIVGLKTLIDVTS